MFDLKLLVAKGLKRLLNPPALRDCNIDDTSAVCSGSELNCVSLGRYTYVGNRCFMVRVKVGSFCSIADRCSIGGATHPLNRVSTSPVFHAGKNVMNKNFALLPSIKTSETIIENDVWLGMGVYVKAGVTIHNGAVIGMASVVTHDVPAYEIWAGNPAKKIGQRFDISTAEKLEKLSWWEWSDERIAENFELFDSVDNILKH